jgi:hypothetical protein
MEKELYIYHVGGTIFFGRTASFFWVAYHAYHVVEELHLITEKSENLKMLHSLVLLAFLEAKYSIGLL